MTATALPYSVATSRSILSRRACSGCDPCEKLRRATSIPAFRSAARTSASSVAGPSVQTILARQDSEVTAEDIESVFIILVYRSRRLQKRKRGTYGDQAFLKARHMVSLGERDTDGSKNECNDQYRN